MYRSMRRFYRNNLFSISISTSITSTCGMTYYTIENSSHINDKQELKFSFIPGCVLFGVLIGCAEAPLLAPSVVLGIIAANKLSTKLS